MLFSSCHGQYRSPLDPYYSQTRTIESEATLGLELLELPLLRREPDFDLDEGAGRMSAQAGHPRQTYLLDPNCGVS